MGNNNLHKALKNKNDEFYTYYTDVEDEMKYYLPFLKNKVIYMNCDDELSAFWDYFYNNFEKIKPKKIVATHLADEPYKLEYDGNETIKTSIQNGDFRATECVALLDSCDVIITNPPFSLFRKFLLLVIEHQKDFIIIGNENSLTAVEVFPLVKQGLIRTGYNKVKEFRTPNGYQKFGNICWYTSFPVDNKTAYKFDKSYDPAIYPQYDNYEAISVDKLKDIPCDYKGIMGVPIGYLIKQNSELFELMGVATGSSKKHRLYYDVPYTPNELDRGGCCVLDGKRKYSRVFIKRVQFDFQ